MPERETINAKIIDILADITLNNEIIEYTSNLRLKEDLGLDSLGFITLVMELNEAFKIEIKSTEIIPDNFATVGQLEEFIIGKV